MFEDDQDPSLFKLNPMRSFVNSGPVFRFYPEGDAGPNSVGQLTQASRRLAQFCFEQMQSAGLWQYRARERLEGYPGSLHVSVIAVPNGAPLVRAWIVADERPPEEKPVAYIPALFMLRTVSTDYYWQHDLSQATQYALEPNPAIPVSGTVVGEAHGWRLIKIPPVYPTRKWPWWRDGYATQFGTKAVTMTYYEYDEENDQWRNYACGYGGVPKFEIPYPHPVVIYLGAGDDALFMSNLTSYDPNDNEASLNGQYLTRTFPPRRTHVQTGVSDFKETIPSLYEVIETESGEDPTVPPAPTDTTSRVFETTCSLGNSKDGEYKATISAIAYKQTRPAWSKTETTTYKRRDAGERGYINWLGDENAEYVFTGVYEEAVWSEHWEYGAASHETTVSSIGFFTSAFCVNASLTYYANGTDSDVVGSYDKLKTKTETQTYGSVTLGDVSFASSRKQENREWVQSRPSNSGSYSFGGLLINTYGDGAIFMDPGVEYDRTMHIMPKSLTDQADLTVDTDITTEHGRHVQPLARVYHGRLRCYRLWHDSNTAPEDFVAEEGAYINNAFYSDDLYFEGFSQVTSDFCGIIYAEDSNLDPHFLGVYEGVVSDLTELLAEHDLLWWDDRPGCFHPMLMRAFASNAVPIPLNAKGKLF